MAVEVRHGRHRHGLIRGDADLLDLPEAQPVIARIAAAVDADYPRRRDHIELVALVALRAKIRPMNVYAKATL